MQPQHVLLKGISTTIGRMANWTYVFANHMFCLYMAECVGFLLVAVVTLCAIPNQFTTKIPI